MARSHTIQDGECLSSLAARYGFRHWQTIYDAPENAELRKSRPNPNLLAPGDVVAIPEHEERAEEAATTLRHEFRLRKADARVRILMADPNGTPRSGLEYKLVIAGDEHTGKTDGSGFIDEPIPRDVAAGTLTVDGETWELRFGALPPAERERDAAALRRLTNLGYAATGSAARARAAVASFQADHQLMESGKLDGDTLATIKTKHGC